MNTSRSLLFLAVFLCCSPAFAEYCAISSETAAMACTFSTKYTPKDTQISVSHTERGWTMTVTVIQKKKFAMIEGDSTANIRNGEAYNLDYVSTRRDMVPRRKLKEAPVYIVSEAFLHELGSGKGKVTFWLAAEDPKEMKVVFSSKYFKDIDAYIAETKTMFADRFQEQ